MGVTRQSDAPAPARRRFYHRCKCGRPIPEASAALLCPDVSGVRSDLGAGHSPAAAWRTYGRFHGRHVLGDGSGRRPVSVRWALLFAPARRREVLGGVGVVASIRDGGRHSTRSAGKWWSELHRAAKLRAVERRDLKGRLAGARVGEAEARPRASSRRDLSGDARTRWRWAEAYVDGAV